ncbi:hypothetical protein RJT34_30129 [Clitoria ternatea]|uniref:Uncharacterized protein n=1 Tax=Clitoria ternatea TaxID=43366 RepID=A0AAN9I3S3_CLITE
MKKTLPCLLNLFIFAFFVLIPFVPPSTSSRIYRTNIATSIGVTRFGNEAASVGIVEDSARKVPTGPDPLHHNRNPIGP